MVLAARMGEEPCRSQQLRSVSSQNDLTLLLEKSRTQEVRSREQTGRIQCSGMSPRSTGTSSTANVDLEAMLMKRLQARAGQRLQRSVSLPISLNAVMMTNSWVPSRSAPCLNLIAENIMDISTDKDTERCDDFSTRESESKHADMKEPVQENRLADTNSLVDCIRNESWSDAEKLCEENPGLAREEIFVLCQGEKCSALVLHLACSNRETPLSVIDALVTAYPCSVLVPDAKRGRLAIHMATLKGASTGVVKYLATAVPKCLSVQDAEGNLPIHYASMHGTNHVLDVLLQARAESCKIPNAKGKLALHVLCARWVDVSSENPVSIEVMSSMICAYPDAITTLDSCGRLPIHVACNMAHPRLDVIQLLLSYKPETILCRDEDKCTPLQLAKRFTPDENGLGVAYLQEVTLQERHRQQKKRAIRMARRVLHFGRNGKLRGSHHNNSTAATQMFNC